MGKFQTGLFSSQVLHVLMCDLLWMDPHGVVDLFEDEQSGVFRLPAK